MNVERFEMEIMNVDSDFSKSTNGSAKQDLGHLCNGASTSQLILNEVQAFEKCRP